MGGQAACPGGSLHADAVSSTRRLDTNPSARPPAARCQVADSKHPSVHKELREKVTFRGPVDAVYKKAPSKVMLDSGAGAWGCGLGGRARHVWGGCGGCLGAG